MGSKTPPNLAGRRRRRFLVGEAGQRVGVVLRRGLLTGLTGGRMVYMFLADRLGVLVNTRSSSAQASELSDSGLAWEARGRTWLGMARSSDDRALITSLWAEAAGSWSAKLTKLALLLGFIAFLGAAGGSSGMLRKRRRVEILG